MRICVPVNVIKRMGVHRARPETVDNKIRGGIPERMMNTLSFTPLPSRKGVFDVRCPVRLLRNRCEQSAVRLWIIIPLLVASAALAQARPSVERVDAILGHPLVLPVDVDDVRALARGTVPIALDDAQRPPVEFFRLEQSGVIDAGWVGMAPRYRAVTPEESLRRATQPPGVWYAVIDLPLEAVTQGIWFGTERFEINWLPDPERAALESDGRTLWASPVPAEAREEAAVAAALQALAQDPFQRWRARLVRDGIAPTGGQDRTGPQGTDLNALRDDLATDAQRGFLIELARHHEARWQLILGRLALIDPEAADRLRRRLGGVVEIDDRWLPMWTPDSPDLRALQADLLSPWVDDRTRVLRALGWLDAQPRALAWVIDDAGDPSPVVAGFEETRLMPTLGLLSLPARDGALLLEVGGALDSSQLSTVPSRRMVRVRTGVPILDRASAAVRTVEIPVRIGRSDTRTEAIASLAPGRPPGVRVGPLIRRWTLPALLQSAPDADALPDHITTGQVRRTMGAPRGSPAAGWSVYLECTTGTPAGEIATGAEDAVTLWTGPYGVPRGVWRVERSGRVHRLFGGSDLVSVRVVETPAGWALDAVLPENAVDEDDVLRIGLTRTLDDEVTAWPRRLMPGQDEPGRFPIDITPWSGL